MKTTIVGFPRIGKNRELKFATEKYFKGELSLHELEETAKTLRKEHWEQQRRGGLWQIPSGDFSYYDRLLDAAVLLGAIPRKYRELSLNGTDTYFAMARGYQGEQGDVPALAMKKWFNTNYHYIVPELEDDMRLKLSGDRPFEEYEEAKELGIETRPSLIGPYTFLTLANCTGARQKADYVGEVADAYSDTLRRFSEQGAEWVQIEEPALVLDMDEDDRKLFGKLYDKILAEKKVKLLLQTYFGDVRDCYGQLCGMDFDALGLDFVEGSRTMELLKDYGFPKDKILFAGLVNGKNIWKSNYAVLLEQLEELKGLAEHVVLSTSCSLLHVPYSVQEESGIDDKISCRFAFAAEKLAELKELSELTESIDYHTNLRYGDNQRIFRQEVSGDRELHERIGCLCDADFTRRPGREERRKIQKESLKLPLLPTTTIGSFPQTAEVKRNRSRYRKNEISKTEYLDHVKSFIADCIKDQEELGLDVLVHGEYERNDMVEFFGENLEGFVFTKNAWVQSYGTRCLKPPIIFSDVKRRKPITTDISAYAQSLTDKPVKGMLTGPVTIFNWSFPREDISKREVIYQIALAIRDEVLDLEKEGIRIIQIDEAALKEKLPLRKEDWKKDYLDFAIPAFRLCHSGVKAKTQIHTHMCYSEFSEIIQDIDDMDADVITFEASRSKLSILDAISESHFQTQVGPGVYDIHSPRVPSVEEVENAIRIMLGKVDKESLWVNPDCGLKTRGTEETSASLRNLVEAARHIRNIQEEG